MQSRNINDDTRAREEMSQADETLSPDKNTSSEPRTGVIDEATSAGYDAVEPTFTKLIEHSHDADDALKALPSSEGAFTELDAANNKRLLRIIDRHLLPMSEYPHDLAAIPGHMADLSMPPVWIIYGIQFLDSW